jgi:Phage tail lysozyme
MTFLDNGWTEEQAQGLLDKLRLTGGIPNWKPEHIQKLRDWCRARDKDDTAIDGQLEFVAHELLDNYQDVALALRKAKTVEEAREAVDPYVRRLMPETQEATPVEFPKADKANSSR